MCCRRARNTTRCPPADDSEDEDPPPPPQIIVPTCDVPMLFRLTHAMCYFTVQGRSFDEGRQTLLLDTEHTFFSRRALIVGMSRVRHGRDLHIATPEYEAMVLGRTRRVFRRV